MAPAIADPAVARLLRTLARSFDGEAWHGPSLREALADCTPDEARARPVPGAHSVWELTLHVTAWADEVRARVDGAPPGLPASGDWPPPPEPAAPDADAAAWRAALDGLDRARDRVLAAVGRLAPARLDQPLPPAAPGHEHAAADALGTRDTLHGVVLGLAEHNAYHGGQIVLLRRACAARAGARA